MLVVPHLIFGAALGQAVNDLPGATVLAFGLGVASHYFLDSLPHWERLVGYKGSDFDPARPASEWPRGYLIHATIDVILAALLLVYLMWRVPHGQFYQNPVFWGALGAVLPDLLDNVPFWSGKIANWPIFKQERYIHRYFHITDESQQHMPKYLGLVTQIAVFLFGAWIILMS